MRSRFRIWPGTFAGIVLVGWAVAVSHLGGCSKNTIPATGIVLEIEADQSVRDRIDQIAVKVGGKSNALDTQFDTSKTSLPIRIALYPVGADEGEVAFEVLGRGNAKTLVTRSGRVNFVSGKTLFLSIHLGAICLDKPACAAGQTCGSGGACEGDLIDSALLPLYSGKVTDAGVDPQVDSAVAVTDTASPADTNGVDAPTAACSPGELGCSCIQGGCLGSLLCKSNTCQSPSCGNKSKDPGEECDDGNTSDADDCLVTCKLATCGDGIVRNLLEECDDGNRGDGDECTNTCKKARCGDGIIWSSKEACDDGRTDDTGACLSTCIKASCGDGKVQSGIESCDDGNQIHSDACPNSCKSASCGDSIVQSAMGEECDDGNTTSTDACVSCKKATCGDGFILTGTEQCDDGNRMDTDLCSNGCISCGNRSGFLQCGSSCISGVCCPATTCAPPSCSGSALTSARTCTGAGTCPAAGPQTCPNSLVCGDSSSCKTSCANDADCTNGRVCHVATARCLTRVTVSVPTIDALCGLVYTTGLASVGNIVPLVAGDDDTLDTTRGLVSFDLNGLDQGTVAIEKAVLTARLIKMEGQPFLTLGSLTMEHVSFETPSVAFGTTALSNLGTFASSGDIGPRSLTVTSAVSDDFINRTQRGGRSQFRVKFSALNDGDSVSDNVWFSNGGAYGPKATLDLTLLVP
jgi:cysteine-rich repeat protein